MIPTLVYSLSSLCFAQVLCQKIPLAPWQTPTSPQEGRILPPFYTQDLWVDRLRPRSWSKSFVLVPDVR